MPTNVYVLSFDTADEVSADDRHGIKDLIGKIVRAGLGRQMPVNVDHLDPAEPHIAALLPLGG